MSMKWLRFQLFTKKRNLPATKEKIVVLGYTLKFKQPTITGAINMVSPPSLKVLENGNGTYFGRPQFQVEAGTTNGVAVTVNPYVGTFMPKAQKTKIEKGVERLSRPLRINDSQTVTMPAVLVAWPHSPTVLTATVVIDDPGQQSTTMG